MTEKPQRKEEWRPVPDPTSLTTEQLHREISSVRELIEARFDSVDKLLTEKFYGVGQKFDLVEKQRVEQKSDTQSAVGAALIAQKESVREQTIASERAIAKSETATMKQLEQLQVNFTTAVEGLRREIGDLKDRVAEVDAKISGVQMQKVGAKEDRTGLYASIAVVLAVLSIISAAVAFMK